MSIKLPSERSSQPLLRREMTSKPASRRRFTAAEYHRIAEELGLFDGQRVQLLNGEIVRMSPQGSRHVYVVHRIGVVLERLVGDRFAVRVQAPLIVGRFSEPEPDIAVVPGRMEDYLDAHPTSAALVIEVADSTLRVDRTKKATIYAKAGVPEYWIVDLARRLIEVRREPKVMGGEKRKHTYSVTRLYTDNESISPLVAPELKLAVAEMLP